MSRVAEGRDDGREVVKERVKSSWVLGGGGSVNGENVDGETEGGGEADMNEVAGKAWRCGVSGSISGRGECGADEEEDTAASMVGGMGGGGEGSGVGVGLEGGVSGAAEGAEPVLRELGVGKFGLG